jgi:hypothetical protein
MFRVFDLPRFRAEKRAAKAARTAREEAFAGALTEIRALIRAEEEGRWVRDRLRDAGIADAAARLAERAAVAEATIERFRCSTREFREELKRRQRSAKHAADHQALADLELSRRDSLVKLGQEAKSQLEPLAALTMEARSLFHSSVHAARLARER